MTAGSMRVLTGNDLATGDVVWWDGTGWSRHVSDAIDTGARAEAVLAREEAARRVNMPYVIEAERTEAGIVPKSLKDRIRAHGPTVRLDLAVVDPDQGRGEWVI